MDWLTLNFDRLNCREVEGLSAVTARMKQEVSSKDVHLWVTLGRSYVTENSLTQAPRSFNPDSANPATSLPLAPTPSINLEIQQQIRELLAQGYRLSLEYANERRFRTNAWTSGGTFQGNEASEVILTLAERLAEHNNEYVRLIGIDPNAKRRILETIIQKPS